MTYLLNLATRIKDDGFIEEREYRIITFGEPTLFYPNATGLIPRIEIDFDPSCLSGITVGPGQHMDKRESSVRIYLKHLGQSFDHVDVSQSKIPFTGL
jgi:hypothetical protein